MNESPDSSHEFCRLLIALCDGVLTDDNSQRLEQILASDAVSREFYRRYLELHAMLQFDDRTAAPGATTVSRASQGSHPYSGVRRVTDCQEHASSQIEI
jgi:hypothetical protein